MHLSTFLITSALAILAAAQGPNHFTIDAMPASMTAGTTFTITWSPYTYGTVSLMLVQASEPGSSDMEWVYPIAWNLTNSGSFVWLVPSDSTNGSNFAFEIISDYHPNIINYSSQFAISAIVSSTVSPSLTTVTSTFSSTESVSSTSSAAASSTEVSSTSEASSSPTETTTSTESESAMMTSLTATTAADTMVSSTTVLSTTALSSTATNAATAVETARTWEARLMALVGAAILVL